MISGNHRNMHVGQKIARLMQIKGIKQDELARAFAITQQSVSKLLHQEKIDEQKLNTIAKVLKMPVKQIMEFDENAEITIPLNGQSHHEVQMPVFNEHSNDDYKTKYIELLEEKVEHLRKQNG